MDRSSSLTNDLILANAPPERAGSAAAISETSSELGGAVGIAMLGSIGTAVYRSRVGTAIPENISPAFAEAARGTLGGALAVAIVIFTAVMVVAVLGREEAGR